MLKFHCTSKFRDIFDKHFLLQDTTLEKWLKEQGIELIITADPILSVSEIDKIVGSSPHFVVTDKIDPEISTLEKKLSDLFDEINQDIFKPKVKKEFDFTDSLIRNKKNLNKGIADSEMYNGKQFKVNSKRKRNPKRWG